MITRTSQQDITQKIITNTIHSIMLPKLKHAAIFTYAVIETPIFEFHFAEKLEFLTY